MHTECITEIDDYVDQIAIEVKRLLSEGSVPVPLMRGSKSPNTPEGVFKDLINKGLDEYQIEEIYLQGKDPQGEEFEREFHGVGIALKPSALWVLDIENPNARDTLIQYLKDGGYSVDSLKATYTVRTGSGEGGHYYFKAPFSAKTVPLNKKPFGIDGIEIKCTGQVVRPPSIHPSGRPYQCVRDLPYKEAPEWLIEEVRNQGGQDHGEPSLSNDRDSYYKVEEGSRNNYLTHVAGKMQHGGLSDAAIDEALLIENEVVCDPPLPREEVLSIAKSVSKYPKGKSWTPEDDPFHSPSLDSGFGENKSNLPVKSFDEFVEEAGEETDWIVDTLLARGELTIFSGRGKFAGKTTFWCHTIAAGARGDTHAGFHTTPAKYLYLTEQGNNFVESLNGSGLDQHKDHIVILPFKDVTSLKWNEIVNRAAFWCSENGFDALIVDTFATFARLRGAEENESGPVGDRMRILRLAVQKNNIGGLLIRHSGKDNVGRGSSAFEDEADIVVDLSRPDGAHSPTVRKLTVFGRHGEMSRNIQLEEGRFVSLGTDDKIEFNKAVEFIKCLLEDYPTLETGLNGPDLHVKAKANGHKKTTVGRALKWLEEKEEISSEKMENQRGKPRVYWRPIHSPQTLLLYGDNESELDPQCCICGQPAGHKVSDDSEGTEWYCEECINVPVSDW